MKHEMPNEEQMEAVSRDAVKLTEYIFKAIDMAEPEGFHEWNPFSGRMEYRKQNLRDAQKASVRMFLERLFSP